MGDIFETNKSLLKSMLLDEDKLITYVSISKDLCVHINLSKTILKRLIGLLRQEYPDLQLNVCYIICGVIQNNNARTVVCSEPDLKKEKECFKVIFFEHIYSVTKGLPSIDPAAYLIVNKFEDFALCCGVIKSKQCDKRTLDEIGNLKSNSQDIAIPEKSRSLPVPVKKINKEACTKNDCTETKFLSKDKESKSLPLVKKEVLTPKKDTIDSSINNKPKINSNNGSKTQKGIAGFFNKTSNGINKTEKENVQSKEIKLEKDMANVKCEEMDVENAIPVVDTDMIKDQKESNTKILNQIKRTSKVDKKRKRVLHVSDSESDNESNDPFGNKDEGCDQDTHNSDDEIPPTPTVTNIVIKSGIMNPKKRRKFVDKTYTDDGFVVTKKVEVYESCSESEEKESPPKAREIKNDTPQTKEEKNEIPLKGKTNGSKKKVSPPQKGKQPTLTNFFKKL